MTSLKEKLKTAIRLRGYVTTSELYEICRKEGYKLSNAERRLRELMHETDEIHADRDAKGTIHGYKWQNSAPQTAFKTLDHKFTPNLDGVKSEIVRRFLTTEWRQPKEEKVSNTQALF